MKSLPVSKAIQWQTEKANKLQRACHSIQTAIERGQPIQRTIRRVARSLDGRPFKCEPARRLALSSASLRRAWDKWKRSGEVPAAFKLNFRSRPPYGPRPLLIRFVEFCSGNQLPSLKAAWQKFSNRRQNARAMGITYGQLCYHFRAADFYLLQAHLKTIETAQAALTNLRFKLIGEITNRLPERAPRRRLKPGTDFQI